VNHHGSLAAAYATAIGLFLLGRLLVPGRRSLADHPSFAKPWMEFGLAILAAAATIGIGQLYLRGLLLSPESRVIVASTNQLLIFAPIVLLPALRRQGPETLYAPLRGFPLRLACGVALALVALAVFSATRAGAPPLGVLLRETASPVRIPVAVQVLLEDLTIGLLLCRLAAALRRPLAAAAAVALLFVAGHVPSMIATGASSADIARLSLDFGLALGALAAVVSSRDVVWFFPVHFAMDVTQFVAAP